MLVRPGGPLVRPGRSGCVPFPASHASTVRAHTGIRDITFRFRRAGEPGRRAPRPCSRRRSFSASFSASLPTLLSPPSLSSPPEPVERRPPEAVRERRPSDAPTVVDTTASAAYPCRAPAAGADGDGRVRAGAAPGGVDACHRR
ncbi:hypothetical protein STXM2123_1100 [Streptomyces sp. F-3]|nr:hypothetical protein STXM2123_1100 [Streptomyces sp. F-3]